MTDFIRRLVSGNKARFTDGNLNLELDLVYLTDRVIIMGYPAEGLESFYRNNREDAKRFLEHRHGKNFWVFNFCPLRENRYPADFFDGRVSRYPFPDHQCACSQRGEPREIELFFSAPPLAIMPLAAREMADWLNGSPERVIVLHCKAGKGRSGTLACTHSASEWAKSAPTTSCRQSSMRRMKLPSRPLRSPRRRLHPSFAEIVHGLAQRRARPAHRPAHEPPGENQKPKQGVSIPSQRRWLHYWALLLAHEAPAHFWAAPPARAKRPRAGAMKMHIVRAASAVIDRTSLGEAMGNGNVWVSLARYDDDFVRLLEKWESHTRDAGGNMGYIQDGKVLTYHSILNREWVGKYPRISSGNRRRPGTVDVDVPASEANSMYDVTQSAQERGVVLTPTGKSVSRSTWGRYLTDIQLQSALPLTHPLLGIHLLALVHPRFHMPQQPLGSTPQPPTKFTLKRKEVDFPLGVGSALIDVEMEMEWLRTTESEAVQPPARQTSAESVEGEKAEPAGLAATVEALAAGNIADAVEAKQAAED
ncbi:hypothetical protein B0H12DRAFT_1212542 [Mycena haematopus]|nr:hypothetical protein B0H12DRAFT_1212542 [Mycena haematopus]